MKKNYCIALSGILLAIACGISYIESVQKQKAANIITEKYICNYTAEIRICSVYKGNNCFYSITLRRFDFTCYHAYHI